MRTPKIYLETSVISHLDAKDRPDREAETCRLWKEIESGKYDVVIGEPVFDEIDQCYEEKRLFLAGKVKAIKYSTIQETDAARRLAAEYIKFGGLKQKSKTDATHIALATLSNCDYVVSWNYRHIVTANAMTAVDSVNLREGIRLVRLVTPTILMGG